MYNGFEPVFDSNSKILILGSFPSVKSRHINFYYGNPQNRFWKVLSQVFKTHIDESIESKKAFLYSRNIALWDIVETCEVEGSLDSNLKNIKVVDLQTIFNVAAIKKIICNGQKSYSILKKYYRKFEGIAICLSSTSPANVAFDIMKWQEELLNI